MSLAHEPLVLAGDVGGTNARLALYAATADGALTERWSGTWPSSAHAGLAEIVELDAAGVRPRAASFGIAGPVRDRRVATTNLPWIVDGDELAQVTGLAHVGLLNDLEAWAWSLPALPEASVLTLQAGSPDPRGPLALVAAGTGLGMAIACREPYRVLPSEGGHATFAPADDVQVALWRLAHERFGHASWERVLSGPGLVLVHELMRERGAARESQDLRDALAQGGGGREIQQAAGAGDDLAAASMRLFARLYASAAANLALTALATGGVYLGGGIAIAAARWLSEPDFTEAFLDKGRFRALLLALPVRVILDDRAGLLGAARHAAAARQA